METAELDAALIENLADLDAINARLEQVGELYWSALGRELERWCKAHGWKGEFPADGEFRVYPAEWAMAGRPEQLFYFDHGPGDDRLNLSLELSRWCGAGGGRICLWFNPQLGQKKWKPVAGAARDELSQAGFHLSDAGNAFLNCTPAQGAVAQAFRNGDLAPAAASFLAALDHAAAAKALFERLIKQASA